MLKVSRFPGLPRRALLAAWSVIGIGGLAGCGESDKPLVKPGDPSTTYKVAAPPPEISNKNPSKGTMSARELRDYKNKQKTQN